MKKRFAFTITPVESPEYNRENEEAVRVSPIHPEANEEEMQESRPLMRRGPSLTLVAVPLPFQERVERRPVVSMSGAEPPMRRIPELPSQARVPERARAFRPPLMLVPVAPPRYGRLNREMGELSRGIFRIIGL